MNFIGRLGCEGEERELEGREGMECIIQDRLEQAELLLQRSRQSTRKTERLEKQGNNMGKNESFISWGGREGGRPRNSQCRQTGPFPCGEDGDIAGVLGGKQMRVAS